MYAYNEHGESPTGAWILLEIVGLLVRNIVHPVSEVAAYMWDDGRPPLPTTTSSTTTSTTLDFPGCTVWGLVSRLKIHWECASLFRSLSPSPTQTLLRISLVAA